MGRHYETVQLSVFSTGLSTQWKLNNFLLDELISEWINGKLTQEKKKKTTLETITKIVNDYFIIN